MHVLCRPSIEDTKKEIIAADLAPLENDLTAIRDAAGGVDSAQGRAWRDGAKILKRLNPKGARDVRRGVTTADPCSSKTSALEQLLEFVSQQIPDPAAGVRIRHLAGTSPAIIRTATGMQDHRAASDNLAGRLFDRGTSRFGAGEGIGRQCDFDEPGMP